MLWHKEHLRVRIRYTWFIDEMLEGDLSSSSQDYDVLKYHFEKCTDGFLVFWWHLLY